MTRHLDRFRHARLTPAEFLAALEALDMSDGEFCATTGVLPKTVKRWLEEEAPPFWVRQWLKLMEVEANRAAVSALADEMRLSEGAYREMREASILGAPPVGE